MEVTLTLKTSGHWAAVRDWAHAILLASWECSGTACHTCPWQAGADIHKAKRRADACTPEQRKALQIDAFDAAFKAFRDRCQGRGPDCGSPCVELEALHSAYAAYVTDADSLTEFPTTISALEQQIGDLKTEVAKHDCEDCPVLKGKP
jgi:hypothetical protein